MIEIEGLCFSYDDKQVLFDINVQLASQTITGLIGPSGAGKSTLMRCIAGLEIPDSGTVRLNGQAILDNPQHSYAQMGYLPDIFGMPERLTVAQYWAYAAKSRGVADEKLTQAVEETAQFLHLAEKLFQPISRLSRGQKQRVGIGQVIIHQPKLLILDEPASGLDPEARYELSCLFNQLREQGMTLLVSSHILAELDEYCTHMLVLNDGKVQQHSAIHGEAMSHLSAGKIPIMLRFASLDDVMLAKIQQAPQLSDIHVDNVQITAMIDKNEQQRVDLIRYLVEQQLPLIGVEPLKESLLANYRKHLGG